MKMFISALQYLIVATFILCWGYLILGFADYLILDRAPVWQNLTAVLLIAMTGAMFLTAIFGVTDQTLLMHSSLARELAKNRMTNCALLGFTCMIGAVFAMKTQYFYTEMDRVLVGALLIFGLAILRIGTRRAPSPVLSPAT